MQGQAGYLSLNTKTKLSPSPRGSAGQQACMAVEGCQSQPQLVQRAHGSGPQRLGAAFYGLMVPHFC